MKVRLDSLLYFRYYTPPTPSFSPSFCLVWLEVGNNSILSESVERKSRRGNMISEEPKWLGSFGVFYVNNKMRVRRRKGRRKEDYHGTFEFYICGFTQRMFAQNKVGIKRMINPCTSALFAKKETDYQQIALTG